MSRQDPALDRAALLLASMFGAGRSPIVPGTVGTLVSLPPAILAMRYLSVWAYALVTAGLIVVAIWSADRTARSLKITDPGVVVIDETAGLFVTLFGLSLTPWNVGAGFVLFRLFDILKPPPAARAERIPGGTGIVLDDLIAGVYANLAVRAGTLVYENFAG